MATLLWNGTGDEAVFTISHQEMIKGVRIAGTGRALSYLDTLVVPIIENTPNEEDLKDSMAEAMKTYPDAAAILVRRAKQCKSWLLIDRRFVDMVFMFGDPIGRRPRHKPR